MYDVPEYNSKLIIYLYCYHRYRYKLAENLQMFTPSQHYSI